MAGTTALTIVGGLSAGELVARFATTWPGLRLELFEASTEFYKDALAAPYRLASTHLFGTPDGAGVTITGDLTSRQIRDLLYRPYGVEADVTGVLRGESLDAAVRRLAQDRP